MTSQGRSIPYACDTSFRAVQSNKYEMDLIRAEFGFADQIHPISAGKSRLDRKTHSAVEVVRRSFQNDPSSGDRRRACVQMIQIERYCIRIQHPVAALEIDESRERGLPGAVRTGDYRECGHAA
jgi:hypothetical protein